MTAVLRWWTSSRNAGRLGAAALLLGAGLLAGVPQALGESGGNIPEPGEGAFPAYTEVKATHAESLPGQQVITTIPTAPVVVHVYSQAGDDMEGEGHVYLVADNADKQVKRPYGVMDTFTVRTLAFGIVPAQVQLQLRQVIYGRDVASPSRRHGFIEPWVLSDLNRDQPKVQGRIMVRIVAMALDGTQVPIGSGCRSAHPGQVHLVAGDGYNPFQGGSMKGTVDIPRFAGCNGMEDVLTAAISGPGNPLEVHQVRLQL